MNYEEYIGGLVVPVALLAASIFSKKLVHEPGWRPTDFYLGVELTLGALTTGLLHLFDIWKSMRQAAKLPPASPNPADNLFSAAVFLGLTFLMFLWVLSFHQDWESKPQDRQKTIRLGIIANGIGFGLMVAFFLVVKGVN